MNKSGFFAAFAMGALLVSGCSCSRIDENTYSSAVSTYKTTDAISFTRVEDVHQAGQVMYTRKKSDGQFVFDSNGKVETMQYFTSYSDVGTNGANTVRQINRYYYNGSNNTYYTYFRDGENQLLRYKEVVNSYEDRININTCDDSDCYLRISKNFAPVYNLNEISNFTIKNENGKGRATFKGICPGFENCASNDQMLDYEVVVGTNGNLELLTYTIVNGDVTYNITYNFAGFGSNNVNITLPAELDNYSDKK